MNNSKVFIVCQGNKVIYVCKSLEDAEAQRDNEIKKDWLSLFLKSKARKMLKKTGVFPSDNYYIAEVVSNEVPNPT